MKKYLFNIALVAGALFMASCTQTMDEIFEVPASQRLDNMEAVDHAVLQSAKNGWRVEYYGDKTYGGYTLFMKFGEDSVTVASENMSGVMPKFPGGYIDEGKTTLNRVTTHYTMGQSMGIVVTLDEYNNIFHYLAEPKNADGVGDSGDGFYGDFEFRIKSACADSVIMEGKKHQNTIKMYPVAEGQTWESICKEIEETENFMKSRSYYIYEDSLDASVYRNIDVTTSYRRLIFYYKDSTGTRNAIAAPYIVTKDGYKFYKAVTVNDYKFDGFLKGETNLQFCAKNDTTFKLVSYIPSLCEQLETDTWFITYSNLPKKAQKWWDNMKKKLKTAGANRKEVTIYWALMGNYSNKSAFAMSADGEPCQIGLKFTQNDEEGNEVKIDLDAKNNNKKGEEYVDKYGLDEVMMTFVGEDFDGRTFTLETDSKRNPTYLLLTDKKTPSYQIKLLYNQVSYPYDN